MAMVPVPPIDELPPAPSIARVLQFDEEADGFLGGLAPWGRQLSQVGQSAYQNAAEAQAQAGAARDAAQQAGAWRDAAALSVTAAQAVSGAQAWVNGAAVPDGAVRWSLANRQNYRARMALAAGVSTLDPASDPARWAQLLAGLGLPEQTLAQAGTYQQTPNMRYVFAAAGVNLVLLAKPAPGDRLGLVNRSGVLVNTVDPNGQLFGGSTEICTINALSASGVFEFSATHGWVKQ